MTEKSSAKAEADRQARRNLLKLGAVAAPLVMTFKSSSAWALSGGCKLVTGTKSIPRSFTGLPTPPYTSHVVHIDNSVGDVITSTSPLTADQANVLMSNGNLTYSCLHSIFPSIPRYPA